MRWRCVDEGLGRLLTATRSGQFEHRSIGGDVAALRRPFFDWLERHSSTPVVREELLDLVTSVADELALPDAVGFTVTADDGGDNLLVRLLVHEADDDLPARLGRGLAVADRMTGRLSVDVVPTFGDGYLLLDVLLPVA